MSRMWHFFLLRFVQFRGDLNSIFFSFGFPLILVLALGFFFSDSGKDKITVYYQPSDKVVASQGLLKNLEASPVVGLEKMTGSKELALQRLRDNKISFFLEFRETDPPYILHYNTTEPDSLIRYQALIRAMEFGEKTYDRLDSQVVLDKQKPYIYTIFPGALGLVLLTIAFIGAGGVLVEERDLGIFKKLKTIDARPFPFLGGLLLSRLVVCMVLVLEMMVVVHLCFGVKAYGSLIPIFVVSLLGTLCFLGIALWLASASRTQAAYMGLINLVQLPLIVLGGVFFSIDVFPIWLQEITIFSPLTAFTVSFQAIIYENLVATDLAQIGKELGILGFWAAVTVLGGMKAFKW